MRLLACLLFGLLVIVAGRLVQGAEPRFRPALIGNGPKALVNVINTKKLVEKGQRDGLLMFRCYVARYGLASNLVILQGTPDSGLLKEELQSHFWNLRFIPAIYNGEPTDVLLSGTLIFL
jgi:hypothetical protein